MMLVVCVLILILMEDALREADTRLILNAEMGLNPYSDGRCSKSALKALGFKNKEVS